MSAVMLAIYITAFTVPFFLGEHYTKPQLTWAIMSGYRLEAAFAYTFVIIALFGMYYLAFRALKANPTLPGWAVYLPPVFFVFSLLAIYPPGGWDLFLYISQGRIYTEHHLNPFIVPPQDAPTDAFFPYSSWWPYPSTYGPAWQMIASLVSIIGGQNLWLSMLLFKIAVSVFFIGSAVLVHLILDRHRPEARLLGVFLLAWNPLVLFETAGNGHNDIVMVFFALLALYYLAQRRHLWSIPLLTISALVKYSSGLLLPGVLLSLIATGKDLKQKVIWSLGGLALAGIALGLFTRPFGMAFSLVALFGLEELYRSSPATLLFMALQGNFPPATAGDIVKGTVALSMGVLYLIELSRFIKRGLLASLDSLVYFGYQSTFFLLLLIPRFHPWFVTWLLGLGVLLVDSEPSRRAVLFSFTAFLSHIVYYYIWGIYGDQVNYFTIEVMANVLIFIPPVVYWMWSRARGRQMLLAEMDRKIVTQEAEIDRLKGDLSGARKNQKTKQA